MPSQQNDYKTLDPTFMESVWWVFKQLFDKGLVYRGFKVGGPPVTLHPIAALVAAATHVRKLLFDQGPRLPRLQGVLVALI